MKNMRILMNGSVSNLVISSAKQIIKLKKDWLLQTKKANIISHKEIFRLNLSSKSNVMTLVHSWILRDYYHESNLLSLKITILKMTLKNKVLILLWTLIAIKFIEKPWVISKFIIIGQLLHITSLNLLSI